ncbi:hypothetical protein MNBD_GAMMA15-378 [hydrothermal vent metagenome]|uniref:Uncharacterized protein n=1 Tax=hydrothermal vent metagenome TaxID=652676 RepID=A0A3B0YBU9_9ZZZZ
MNKIILIIISALISGYIHADVGDKWPSEQELSKAPTWPSKYNGNPRLCNKPNEELFYKYQNDVGYVDEEAYEIDSYIDLNLDGICEIIAFQRMYCGNKECGYIAFQVTKQGVKDLGQVALGDFLAPLNGWLQIRSRSYTGAHYSIHLVKFINGSYRFYRSDRFEYFEKNNQTKYIKTDYRK